MPVSMTLESTCTAREEHAVLILDDCTLVEVNCSGYLDWDNYVRIHASTRERAMEIATAILRAYYKRRLQETRDNRVKTRLSGSTESTR